MLVSVPNLLYITCAFVNRRQSAVGGVDFYKTSC